MPFPEKFRELLETQPDAVTKPSHVWVTYAVCATEDASCGWGGWMLEAAFAGESSERRTLASASEQQCPRCGRETFRTAASFRFDLSADQEPVRREGVDYVSRPLEYK